MNKPICPVCPVCKEKRHIRFVFADTFEDGKWFLHNPSDYPSLFLCPNLHVFDNASKEVVSEWKAQQPC